MKPLLTSFLGLAILLSTIGHALVVQEALMILHMVLIALGIIILALGLKMISLAKRIHPSIKRFSRLTLNPSVIKNLADSDEQIPITLGNKNYKLVVHSVPTFEESFEIITVTSKGTKKEKITESISYSGTVQDFEKHSDVRLTITEHFVAGYIRFEKDWWFIEPLKKFRINANVNDYVAYKTSDLKFKLELHDVIPEPFPEYKLTHDLPDVKPKIGINFAIDKEYLEQANWTPLSAYQHNLFALNTINGVYKREFGFEFQIKNLVVSPETLTSNDSSRLLRQLEQTVRNSSLGNMRLLSQRQSQNSELVHLTTAKNLKNNILGVAYRPGVYGLSNQQLIWVGGGGGIFGGAPNLAYINMLVMAHEIGHNFDGYHEEAHKRCKTKKFGVCWNYVRTIMWYRIFDDNEDKFSDGTLDSSHNNIARIKTHIPTRSINNF